MGRPLALNTEIFDGLYDTYAKALLPEAIHVHSGGERVGGIDEPFRKTKTVPGGVLGPRRQNSRNAGFHLFALPVVFAAHEQEGIARLVRFLRHHGSSDLLLNNV